MGEPECLGEADIAELVKHLLKQVHFNHFLHFTKIDKKEAKRNSGVPGPDKHICEADWERAWEMVGEDKEHIALISGFRKTALYLWIGGPDWRRLEPVSELPLLKSLTDDQREKLGHAFALVVLEAFHKGKTLTVAEARLEAMKATGIRIETEGEAAKRWGGIMRRAGAAASGGIVSPDRINLQLMTSGKTTIKRQAAPVPVKPAQPEPVTQDEQESGIEGLEITVTTKVTLGNKPLILKGELFEVNLEGPGGMISFQATRIEINRMKK